MVFSGFLREGHQVCQERVQNKFPNAVRAAVFVIPAQVGNQLIRVFLFPA